MILSVWRYIVIVNQEFRNVHKWTRQSRRGKFGSVRFFRKKKDDEFRIMRGEVSKKRVQKTIGVISTAAGDRDLRGPGLCRDRIMLLLQDTLQERIVKHCC